MFVAHPVAAQEQTRTEVGEPSPSVEIVEDVPSGSATGSSEPEPEPSIEEPPAAAHPGVIDQPPQRDEPGSSEADGSRRRPSAEQIRPAGEDEMMEDHPVGQSDIAFRPGRGLEINSTDEDFQLRIRVRVQLLYTLLRGMAGPREADEPEDLRNDFRIRRARVIFQGHAFGKDNQYKFEIDPLRPDNVVLDYYLDFTKKRDVQVRVGQYKISSNRQRVISSGDLQMVDRSSVNAEFSLDRDIGLDVRSRDFLGKNKMRYVLGISSGTGLNNFQFQDFGMLYLARFEYLPLGIFEDYSEVDFERTRPRLSIGTTYAFFVHAERQLGMIGPSFADGGTANYHFAYADVMFKVRGFSLLSEFALRTGKRLVGDITTDPEGNPIEPTPARDGVGWMAQAGYLIPHTRLELAGRGSILRPTTDTSGVPESNAVTFSASWYFFQHPFKIQADVSEEWESESFGDGATTVRVQLQASL
jgi:hypothetical protein